MSYQSIHFSRGFYAFSNQYRYFGFYSVLCTKDSWPYTLSCASPFSFFFFSFPVFFFFFICGGFCHTLKWNSQGFTCVPHHLIYLERHSTVVSRDFSYYFQCVNWSSLLCMKSLPQGTPHMLIIEGAWVSFRSRWRSFKFSDPNVDLRVVGYAHVQSDCKNWGAL